MRPSLCRHVTCWALHIAVPLWCAPACISPRHANVARSCKAPGTSSIPPTNRGQHTGARRREQPHCRRAPALATPACCHETLDIDDMSHRKRQPQNRAYRYVADLLHLVPQKPLLALQWRHTSQMRHSRWAAQRTTELLHIRAVLQLTLVCFRARPMISPTKARASMIQMLNRATCIDGEIAINQ
jgi:hypothetical protein